MDTGAPGAVETYYQIDSASIISTETQVSIGSKPCTVYRVEVVPVEAQPWVVAKRFSEFGDLRAALMAIDKQGQQVLGKQEFPPKHLYGSMQEEVVAKRLDTLQAWLSVVVQHYRNAVPLLTFLTDDGSENSAMEIAMRPSSPPKPRENSQTDAAEADGTVTANLNEVSANLTAPCPEGVPPGLVPMPPATEATGSQPEHKALFTAMVEPGAESTPTPAEPEPEMEPGQGLPSAEVFCGAGTGLSTAGIKHCIRLFGSSVTDKTTTSDICHGHIKPATVPYGWIDEPELICFDDDGNDISANGWYKHVYRKVGALETQSEPPPGTRSMCTLLAADPRTAHFVGKPTHFLSHAWLYRILNVAQALEEFEESQPEGTPPIFWWFDCFAIDEHSTQELSQEWWSTTFKQAIKLIGHTVMFLSPWDTPQTLVRAWCLWELHCTIETDSEFSIHLGSDEKKAFRATLSEDGGDKVIAMISAIDVRKSQASDPQDLQMILDAVDETSGGSEALNQLCVGQLRDRFVGAEARKWVTSLLSADGSLETAEAVNTGWSVANLLGHHLGRWTEAEALWQQVVAGSERLRGSDHSDTLAARSSLARVMEHLGQVPEAKLMYEDVLEHQIVALGNGHEHVMTTQANLAALLKGHLRDYEAALPLEEQVVEGFTALYGLEAERTLQVRTHRALTYAHVGRCDEARAEYETVLAIQKALPQLGPRNPATLYTQWSLADLLNQTFGEEDEALKMLRNVTEVSATVLGVGHEITKTATNVLARRQKEYEDGEWEEWGAELARSSSVPLHRPAMITQTCTPAADR